MSFRFRESRFGRDDVSEADERYGCIDPRTGALKTAAQIRGEMADEDGMDADLAAAEGEEDRKQAELEREGRISGLDQFFEWHTKEET